MTKYIDTDRLLAGIYSDNPKDVMLYIATFTAADVAEVKHGKWEYVKKRLARGGYVDASECSVCHKIIMPHLKPNYCPNCGAKMVNEDV